jgi:site-specific recombinase XerD
MSNVSWVQRGGPLALLAMGYRSELERLGFTDNSVVTHVVLMGQLSRWLSDADVAVGDLSEERVAEFFATRRAGGQRRVQTAKTLRPMFEYLRAQGVIAPRSPGPGAPLDDFLASYRRYLLEDRGLAASTVVTYQAKARLFLSERMAGKPGTPGLEGLSGADVTAFLLRECSRVSVGSAKNTANTLRSLLRFLRVEGLIGQDWASAVPPVAGWRDTSLPSTLEASEVAELLASCNRSESTGMRDFAILTLLGRLGLRCCEVANLELDDIDWRAGQLKVRGKSRREDPLPLLSDVGQALASYLRHGRPLVESRRVFLTCLAPLRGLTAASVGSVVRRACERAGRAPVGAHRLRHSLATEMLRQGVALSDISQVLRHQDLATTQAYAKVDLVALRRVCRPWPEGQQR